MQLKLLDFWFIEVPGWVLLIYLVVSQAPTAINYNWGIMLRMQESADQITPIGVAFFYGFALADLLVYIPMLAIGLYVFFRCGEPWGKAFLTSALGITAYWPIVSLGTLMKAHNVQDWKLAFHTEKEYSVVLPILSIWAVWALLYISLFDQNDHRRRRSETYEQII